MENGGSTPFNTAEPFVKIFETIDEEVLLDDNNPLWQVLKNNLLKLPLTTSV